MTDPNLFASEWEHDLSEAPTRSATPATRARVLVVSTMHYPEVAEQPRHRRHPGRDRPRRGEGLPGRARGAVHGGGRRRAGRRLVGTPVTQRDRVHRMSARDSSATASAARPASAHATDSAAGSASSTSVPSSRSSTYPAGEVLDELARRIGQAEGVQQLGRAGLRRCTAQAQQPADEDEILATGEVLGSVDARRDGR